MRLAEIEVGADYRADLSRYEDLARDATWKLRKIEAEPWKYELTDDDRAALKFSKLPGPYSRADWRESTYNLRVRVLAVGVAYGKTRQGVEVEWSYLVTLVNHCPTCGTPQTVEVDGEPVRETRTASGVVHAKVIRDRWEAYEVERALKSAENNARAPWLRLCDDEMCPHLIVDGLHSVSVCRSGLTEQTTA